MNQTPPAATAETLWTQYRDATPAFAYTLGQLDRLVSRRLGEILQSCGASLPQYTMLSNLHMHGATANAALAARSFITPQAANQIVNGMMEKGWVCKRSAPDHGRIVLIELTGQGRDVYLQCSRAAAECEQQLTHGLTPETLIMLKATLRRMLSNLRGY